MNIGKFYPGNKNSERVPRGNSLNRSGDYNDINVTNASFAGLLNRAMDNGDERIKKLSQIETSEEILDRELSLDPSSPTLEGSSDYRHQNSYFNRNKAIAAYNNDMNSRREEDG